MDRAISSADANRQFSRILREVRAGNSFTLTAHGKPVARIVPVGSTVSLEKIEARRAFFERLRTREPVFVEERWTRDGLYER